MVGKWPPYAQCWEDAEVLLEGLDVSPGDVCLSVASAGDNVLALLTRGPARVIAVDIAPASLACLELRVAAFRALEHSQVLELIGAAPSARRAELYRQCRVHMSRAARAFWDDRPRLIAQGIGKRGVFEDHFRAFRRWILPLIHGRSRFAELLALDTREERQRWYAKRCNNWRWRLALRMLFSRRVMQVGHGPGFFEFSHQPMWPGVLMRLERALVEPRQNPYLQWLLLEKFATALPVYLRPENFLPIRQALDRLQWHHMSLEDAVERFSAENIHRFNLSNILEYMPPAAARRLLQRIAQAGAAGGRLLYWDMVSARTTPGTVPGLQRLEELGTRLFQQNKFCFFNALVIEQIKNPRLENDGAIT